MTNQELIQKRFAAFRRAVEKGGSAALCEQMERGMDLSLNLHEQLEGGAHAHHLEESDSHGWAVANGAAIVASGASDLSQPNEYGSAEEDAKSEAVRDNPGLKGVFSSVLANPFEGGVEGDNDEDDTPSNSPHDSVRFETKIHDLLKVSAHQNFSVYFRKNVKAAMRNEQL